VVEAVYRILVGALSAALLLAFFRSLITMTLAARHRSDPIRDATARLAWALFRLSLPARSDRDRLDDRLAWFWPITVFAIMGVWYTIVIVAFAGFYVASGAVEGWVNALVASGSAVGTLGFDTPAYVHGRFIAIVEGGMGLFVMVYVLTFLPRYRRDSEERSAHVAWLYARTGSPPSAAALLEGFSREERPEALTSLWTAWEGWFRDLDLTHSSNPSLITTRSFHAGEYSVGASAAVLHAAALARTAIEASSTGAARVCWQAGVSALADISSSLGLESATPGPGEPSVELAAFEAGLDRLAAAGMPIRAEREAAWRGFVALRAEYEHLLRGLARESLVELGPWPPPGAPARRAVRSPTREAPCPPT